MEKIYFRAEEFDYVKKTIIVGGGLAGLVAANVLVRAGIACIVIEKKEYPFHRVCGEYISNETVPYLKSLGLYPEEINPVQIKRFQLTSVNGKAAELPLDLGGFGISRYSFDRFLYQRAKSNGVEFILNTEVESILFANNNFEVKTSQQLLSADIVIGAFGKRSKLDVRLNRDFINQRSPYVAVKYHVRTEHPLNLISLHNFQDGYCGISNIEEGKSCLCYLTHRKNLKEFGSIKLMEENVLFKNPFLKSIFSNSHFLFEKPETINEISFSTKEPVEDHILMCGDAAGMITPLCGNGMAMAIHSAKIVSELIIDFCAEKISREELEKKYSQQWHSRFAKRLWAGRQIQRLFGSVRASDFAVNLARHAKPVAGFLISKTHGDPF
ncbi:MAG TPA: NAD(P)/FAD-dependent oxidoreductase [Cyclobacteriaceae bacterium]|nr:NAD(P)/FAD-dependent oxidoreductase [Cyclobacteriaceae bacterium]